MNLLFLILALLYGALAGFVWHYWRRTLGAGYLLKNELLALTPILLLHTWAVWYPVLHGVLDVGLSGALVAVSWLMVFLYWRGSMSYSLQGLQLLLYPISTLMTLAATFLPLYATPYPVMHVPFALHLGAALSAYGLFGITSLLALLLLFVNRQLHAHRFSRTVALPPLLGIEELMFRGVWAGFILLSAVLLSGLLFSTAVFHKVPNLSHKTVFGVISWVMYGGVLIAHCKGGLRGKKAARWLLAAFVFLVLAYMGSRFVSELILHHVH